MSKEDRMSPQVIESLKKAHTKYIIAKRILGDSCELLGFDKKLMDIKLDIGYLSKREDEYVFNSQKLELFQSPNVIYNENNEHIFFIDFSLGEWNENKEKVYNFIMRK